MAGFPTGTVTFLFTDIESSTRRWEERPEEMQRAFSRQEAILRAAIAEHGGYAYKMIGDAFQAAFRTPLDALAAAIEAQRALRSEPWPAGMELRVRMAMHTGITEERGDDYVGPLLNRVARLLSAGYGGQVLVSEATASLLRDHLPPGGRLTDLGEHRLKDLSRPEHVYQLVADGLSSPSEFPPLKTLDARPNNLPMQVTTLVGRDKEIAAVCEMLRRPEVRLATLTGPGGTGKTRLALQVGAEMLDDFQDVVYAVELASLTDSALVVFAIAGALSVREASSQPILDTLIEHLRNKQMLLLLDNFEHLLRAAPAVDTLLRASPKVNVLATSRATLRLYGEHEFPVPPLAVPDPGHLPPLELLTQYEAIRLFIERARAAKPSFEVTHENAPAVAEICAALDGLPLAIELAAARVKLFPPAALLSRLENRLQMLTGGAANLPVRQQTLRNAIAWSYDLLSDAEQQMFTRMSVFQGGHTLEALEAVCVGMDILDGVQSLVDKSLLRQTEGSDGEPRFAMLETIQEYAREKLAESGEETALRRKHALYFMRLAEGAEPHLTGRKQTEWYNRLEEEQDNIRAALRWAGEQEETHAAGGEGHTESTESAESAESADSTKSTRNEEGVANPAEVGLRIAGAIWRFWLVRGLLITNREQLGRLLSLPPRLLQDCSPRSRARGLSAAGLLAWYQGDFAEARSLHEQALALYREAGDKRGIAFALNSLGDVAYEQGDHTTARARLEQSLALRRKLDDKGGIGISLSNLGIVALGDGDYAAARPLHEESLALFRELGVKGWTSGALNNLALVDLGEGDFAAARALFEECLALRIELKNSPGIATCLSGLGCVAVGTGQAERGARLFGAMQAIMEPVGGVLNRQDRLPYERSVEQARAKLGEETFERLRQEGRAMSMGRAIEYALERP